MAFTGNEDQSITLNEASKLTKNYRDKAGQDANLGGYFSKVTFERILNQDRCVGIRFYYAEQDNGTKELVLVGVERDENDISSGELAERITPCPPYCGDSNPLNS